MKAEIADKFKFAIHPQEKLVHIVFEQIVPALKRDSDNNLLP